MILSRPIWLATTLRSAFHVIAAVALLAAVMPASAQDTTPYKIAGGLAVYLGVIPAEMIKGHPKGHPEAEMHGGRPADQGGVQL